MPKALPGNSRYADTHDRIRHDHIDKTGAVTLRVNGRMHHIGAGRTQITEGSPLRGHLGRQVLTPTADGGTLLDYTIGFNVAPACPASSARSSQPNLTKGLPKLTD